MNTLQESLLQVACFNAAKNAIVHMKPTDASAIECLAASFYEVAINHLGLIASKNRDPNVLVRAIDYLSHVHGIPPMEDATLWFQQSLTVLVELAVPSMRHTDESIGFLADVEQGVIESRADPIK
jgi:hypothetical protein